MTTNGPDDSGNSEAEDLPLTYALRISAQADQDITQAALFLGHTISGEGEALTHEAAEKAKEWRRGLYAELRKLNLFPRGHAVVAVETQRFGMEVRQMVYRRPGSSSAYRVLFNVADDGPDGPRVSVIHVRHAARRPPTRDEVRQILANQ